MSIQQSQTPGQPPPRGRKALTGGRIVAGAVGLAALLLFMTQNTERVRVNFAVWHLTWAVWLLVLVSAIIGALVWIGVGVVRRRRRRVPGREAR